MGNTGSKELLEKALAALHDKYDAEDDCFFVVITKDGKHSGLDVSNQTIIGEMNVKTLIPFILQSVYQVCSALELSPYDFISKYIVGSVLDEERALEDLTPEIYDDYEEDDAEEEDDDEFPVMGTLGDSVN